MTHSKNQDKKQLTDRIPLVTIWSGEMMIVILLFLIVLLGIPVLQTLFYQAL